MLSSAEKYLTEIEAWIVNRDPFSEMVRVRCKINFEKLKIKIRSRVRGRPLDLEGVETEISARLDVETQNFKRE